MNTKTDLLAKLLANENLTVVQEPVRTASFDIKNRVLRIPQWKEMTDDLMDMLIGHEVGHALYTTSEFWDNNVAEKYPHIHGYFNVCEDVRIEKLMKRRYPGLRRSFNLGYKDLNQRDFFNVAKSNFKEMLLIDKINLYYKAGYACGVEFTVEEKEFVRRAEATETIQEVIELSIDIYNYSKDALDKKMQSMQEDMDAMKAEDQEYEDSDNDDEDSEEGDMPFEADQEQESEKDVPADGQGEDEQEDESDLESKTEKALRKKLDELSDTETTYTYYTIPEKLNINNPIVSYKDVIAKIKDITQEERDWLNLTKVPEDKLEKFLNNSKRVVSYLVKEFEMKKSAELLRRAKIAKTGSLDGKKLYSYKLNDDIFKQVMTIPQGKNHGMLFLLDWSGSMDQSIQPTIEQVINLAMFCRGIQIPFQVFAFTDHYYTDNQPVVPQVPTPGTVIVGNRDFKLLELFSNKMSNSDFNYMVENITHPSFTHRSGFRLGGTPLNQALTFLYNYIPNFKAQNKIEKLTLITLTDGDGNHIYGWDSKGERTVLREGRRYIGRNAEGKELHVREIPHYRDTVTKKSYRISEECDMTKGLLQMIKDRHDITVLGFFITRTGYYNLASALYSHYGTYNRASALELTEMRKKMKQQGFVSLKDTGRDDLFLIPITATKIQDEGVLETSSKDSAAKIARNFSKFLNTKKESRVLLSKFVSWVA